MAQLRSVSNITNVQLARLEKIVKESRKRSIKCGVKNSVFLILSLLFIVFVDAVLLNSNKFFAFLSAFGPGWVWFRLVAADIVEEFERVKKETNEILES